MGGGQGAQQPSKGVGGYRPTINWREIAVRKKLMADKQVLVCIVVAGVVIVVAGVIMTVLAFLVIGTQCPFQWREGEGACYYFAPHNATWEEGRSYCTSQSASLLHIHSQTEGNFINEKMEGRSWLGARRDPGQQATWAWQDSGGGLNYSRWEGDSVPAHLRKSLCAAVEPSGEWIAVECDGGELAYVICDYTPGYNPFVLVGPVVVGCGVVVLVLSVEVCIRRREFFSKNPEPEEEEDDRQVDEGIINQAFGHHERGEVEEEEEEEKRKRTIPGGGEGGRDEEGKKSEEEKQEKKDSEGKRRKQNLGRIKKVVVVSPTENKEEKEEKKQKEASSRDRSNGSPAVEVIPASPVPLSPVVDESSPSQDNLELLLSPKSLQ